MPEVAINAPFDSNEIKDIACKEFRKRLDSLGPLQGAKEYSSFLVSFQVGIRLRRPGDIAEDKNTLAWGSVEQGRVNPEHVEESETVHESFESGDPNDERLAHNMPLTVETRDGRGNISRKKVNVK